MGAHTAKQSQHLCPAAALQRPNVGGQASMTLAELESSSTYTRLTTEARAKELWEFWYA